jgi:uncharacterized membrane protein YuzA (DUF378 family)
MHRAPVALIIVLTALKIGLIGCILIALVIGAVVSHWTRLIIE